jgi:Asp-tRNA(Asn)/Glu-tRNA(Gln) amidotransferase C subunit
MDRRQLDHLCTLARLHLADDEIAEFERKFTRLLVFVEAIQAYQPQTEGAPLTLKESVGLRLDTKRGFSWPEGTAHDYKVPRIIDFEGGG